MLFLSTRSSSKYRLAICKCVRATCKWDPMVDGSVHATREATYYYVTNMNQRILVAGQTGFCKVTPGGLPSYVAAHKIPGAWALFGVGVFDT